MFPKHILLILREILSQATERYKSSLIVWAKTQNCNRILHWQGCTEQILSYIAGVKAKWYKLYGEETGI